MRLWILFGCGVLILAGALWPFGKRTEQPGTVPTTAAVAVRMPIETPKPAPAPVNEVIDLSRAYEPVREPEEPAGTVNPASFIQIPEAPKRIPPAMDFDNPYRDVLQQVEQMQTGTFIMGAGFWPLELSSREVLKVMPREVPGLFRWPAFHPFAWDAEPADGDIEVTWPLGFGPIKYIPLFHGGIEFIRDNRELKVTGDQLIALRGPLILTGSEIYDVKEQVAAERAYAERLDEMQRVVPASFVVKSPDGCVLLCPPGLEGKCQRSYPVERINVMPREVTSIQSRMSDFVPATNGQLVFTPMGVPYSVGIVQPIPPNASIQNGLLNFIPTGVETKLTIMPRVVKQSD